MIRESCAADVEENDYRLAYTSKPKRTRAALAVRVADRSDWRNMVGVKWST